MLSSGKIRRALNDLTARFCPHSALTVKVSKPHNPPFQMYWVHLIVLGSRYQVLASLWSSSTIQLHFFMGTKRPATLLILQDVYLTGPLLVHSVPKCKALVALRFGSSSLKLCLATLISLGQNYILNNRLNRKQLKLCVCTHTHIYML